MKWTLQEEIFLKNNYDIPRKKLAKMLNRSVSSIQLKIVSMGLSNKTKIRKKQVRYEKTNGYIVIREPDYPIDWPGRVKNKKSDYVYEHYVIWWRNHPNKIPEVNEVLHHKNRNRKDNSIDNLILLNKSEHTPNFHEELIENKQEINIIEIPEDYVYESLLEEISKQELEGNQEQSTIES